MAVQAEPGRVAGLIGGCRATIAANSDHLCALDHAIGAGDHGTNMRRGGGGGGLSYLRPNTSKEKKK
ncbi:hypothetical protein ACCS72_39120, partial [Rhizobium ruizarguesonis]